MHYIDKSSNKQSAIWQVINRENGKRTHETIQSSVGIEEFSKYFSTVGEKIIGSIPPSPNEPMYYMRKLNIDTTGSLFLSATSEYEIVDIINGLKNKNSKDIYGFSIYLLKQIKYEIAGSLTYIINKCINEGCFPDQLKLAKVVPVYKKGDADSCDNFRPISLLPVLSKVLETAINKRLICYLETAETPAGGSAACVP